MLINGKASEAVVAAPRIELKVHGIYRHACPNCGGPISDLRLLYKAPCERCLPEDRFNRVISEVSGEANRLELLKKYRELLTVEGNIKKLVDEEAELNEFEEFFKSATRGFKMWSAQRMWAKRLLRRESFCIIAPTGTGKTVFSLVATLYRALKVKGKNRKCYLAFPTTPLLLQAWSKLLKFAENIGVKVCTQDDWHSDCLRVICIHGRLSKREREFYDERLRNEDYDILLTTSAYMHRHGDVIPKGVYDLVVMDDVDAVLRSGKAVQRLLNVLGLSDDAVNKGLELVKLKARMGILPPQEAEKTRALIEGLERELEEARRAVSDTVLIVNSATGKPRGAYSKLFRVFLNFEAGARPEAIRNIVDTYVIPPRDKVEEVLIDILRKLRGGVLVFVTVDKGIEYAEYLAARLREHGLRAEAFHSKKQVGLVERFAAGEIDVMISVATYYGVMVRGIDLPERVKYTIFVGVPRHKFSTKLEAVPPADLLRLLVIAREALEGREREEADVLIGRIARRLRTMSQGALAVLREKLLQALQGKEGGEMPILKDLLRAYEIIKNNLNKPDFLNKLSRLGDVALISENSEVFILVPDVATYIQASGRCSRLYPGGITKGLSVIIVDDERLLNGLIKRLRWIFEGFKISKLEEIDLERLIEEIEEEREFVKKVLSGEVQAEKQLELVKTALLVVESPNKARTIASFFGKPSIRVIGEGIKAYEVTIGNYILDIVASGGHVYDLVVDQVLPEARGFRQLYGVLVSNNEDEFIPVYTDIKKCVDGHQFTEETLTCPRCGRLAGRKLNVIDALRKIASEVDVVFIGTDPDAEGEKIAWDLKVLLEPYSERVWRVEFHEVTRRAVINAILNPREFDHRLVEAQIVRRVEDRWLGFSLSEIVQKYAWKVYCIKYLCGKHVEDLQNCFRPNRNLSAGRVQTPVLEYVIEEYRKHKDPAFFSYVVRAYLEGDRRLRVTLSHEDVKKLGLLDRDGRLIGFGKKGKVTRQLLALVTVDVLEERENEVMPPPPFTTDTLLEEASRLLGFSTTKTMELAQELFEMGFITYHRTDSTRISDAGIDVARQYLEERYGPARLLEVFKPRTWSTSGAHEAIRPTRPIDADHLAELLREGAIITVTRVTRDHLKLYDLIFRRFIASQMKPAKVLKQKLKVELQVNGNKIDVEKDAIVGILDKGYSEIYENIQIELDRFGGEGSKITGFIEDVKRQKYPLPRFHDVIRWMKTCGIGRPSTYAKIIQTLIDRKYVAVSRVRKAFIVKRRGKEVFEFLKELYGDLVSVNKTSELERDMDLIERGEVSYQQVLAKIYREVTERIIGREADAQEHVKKELKKFVKELEKGAHPLPRECVEGLLPWISP
ncbi:MAG: reverse gyrase [Desulfurococcaceae archaeon]